MNRLLTLLIGSFSIVSCTRAKKEVILSESEKWRLGWRIMASSWNENYQLGELQFDSLMAKKRFIRTKIFNYRARDFT